jgi:hypothetical protein
MKSRRVNRAPNHCIAYVSRPTCYHVNVWWWVIQPVIRAWPPTPTRVFVLGSWPEVEVPSNWANRELMSYFPVLPIYRICCMRPIQSGDDNQRFPCLYHQDYYTITANDENKDSQVRVPPISSWDAKTLNTFRCEQLLLSTLSGSWATENSAEPCLTATTTTSHKTTWPQLFYETIWDMVNWFSARSRFRQEPYWIVDVIGTYDIDCVSALCSGGGLLACHCWFVQRAQMRFTGIRSTIAVARCLGLQQGWRMFYIIPHITWQLDYPSVLVVVTSLSIWFNI